MRQKYLAALLALPACAQVAVLTAHYDNARTGANVHETILNTTNVTPSKFGKLYSYDVDASVFAQPLYVPGVAIAGKGTKNALYVASMNNTVYAFDADAKATLWSVNFNDPDRGVTAVPIADITGSDSQNISGPVGIESTPVIDAASKTIYLLARTKETGKYVQRLHALDIATGAERTGSPVTIEAALDGSGYDAKEGRVVFNAKMHNQRPGLALANGQVFIAWASHEDDDPYHGWVLAYDASTLRQTGLFCVTPDGQRGGIWQSGRAPAVDDSGNVYYITGNGDYDGKTNFSEAFVKIASKPFKLTDWFTPQDQEMLTKTDADLGSSGPLMIPGTTLLAGAGKTGILYLIDTSKPMGHVTEGNTQLLQSLPVSEGEVKGGPVLWKDSPLGTTLYIWGDKDYLKAFHFNGATFDAAPSMINKTQMSAGSPGGILSISANGGAAGTGIVWASIPINQDADQAIVPSVLHAFDAANLKHELWNSQMNSVRDAPGLFAKFAMPVVADGKLYVPTFQRQVHVYGLLPDRKSK